MLFLDHFPNEPYVVLRQIHIPTFTLSTIYSYVYNPNNVLASFYAVPFPDRLLLVYQTQYITISPTTIQCPAGLTSLQGAAPCSSCPFNTYSNQSTQGCQPCSTPTCTTGQTLIACDPTQDAYCQACSNKPSNAVYISNTDNICTWVYKHPCPAGYYSSPTTSTCSTCPPFTTSQKASMGISSCTCINGSKTNGECIIPSPFTPPTPCDPLKPCQPYTQPASPFPILSKCTSAIQESVYQICPCDQGSYIAQIHPKICTPCPKGLYSTGQACLPCPLFMEPSLDQSTCRCAVGKDTALTSLTPICACGPGMQFSFANGCTPCPQNSVSDTTLTLTQQTTTFQCTPCPEGYISSQNICIPCPAGQYRTQYDTTCQACPKGLYAPSPSSSDCQACQKSCGALQSNPCPTDSTHLYTCSPCPEPRPNSTPNGQSNCATSCDPSFYELENACVPCTTYTQETCPAGYLYLPCTDFSNSACIPCTNSTMPLRNSQWTYTPSNQDGPNALCTWGCNDNYTPIKLPSAPIWQCLQIDSWTLDDLFA